MPLHGLAVLHRIHETFQRADRFIRRRGETDPPRRRAHLRSQERLVLSRLGRDQGAGVGRQDHRRLLQFLGPRHRLVRHGAGGRARRFPERSSRPTGNHRHVEETLRRRRETPGPGERVWWQVVDQGSRPGNYLEASASSMFVYAMAKGVNRGYLSRDYVPAIIKGYKGIIDKLIKTDADGSVSLTHCCSVAGLGFGRDGSFAYYIKEPVVDNDLKGVGPFILAGIEVQQLISGSMTVPKR